jgi:hypothetical protein
MDRYRYHSSPGGGGCFAFVFAVPFPLRRCYIWSAHTKQLREVHDSNEEGEGVRVRVLGLGLGLEVKG